MGIIEFLFILICIGVGVMCVNRFLLTENPYRTIFNLIVALLVLAWILDFFGLWDLGGTFKHRRATRANVTQSVSGRNT